MNHSNASFRLKTVTPNLLVKDVNLSAGFYCSLFGFEIIASVPESGKFDFVMLRKDQVTLMLQTLESWNKTLPDMSFAAAGGAVLLYADVDQIDQIYARVKDAGVSIAVDMDNTFYGTREFTITDPDGYLICFAEDYHPDN